MPDDFLILKTHRETNAQGRKGDLTLHLPNGRLVPGAIKFEYSSEPGVEEGQVRVTFLAEYLQREIGELDPTDADHDCGCG